ncbi:MAG: thymidylate synthase [Saccharofermentanales bacterium]
MIIDSSEYAYLEALNDVLHRGEVREDRTGVGTKSLFGYQMKFKAVADRFPLLTTKELKVDSIKSELLWMIEGSGDERRLAEIRYGKPREELEGKKTIWTKNAHTDYWVKRGLKKHEGDLGEVYGVQWRNWDDTRVIYTRDLHHYDQRGFNLHQHINAAQSVVTRKVDQLVDLIEGIKKDPFGRRHIITAWNPARLYEQALPPCHVLAQFYVHTDGKLDCLLYQRSADLFLGSPYNIAFYSMFLAMVAQVCGYETGDLTYHIGDAHIYLNHIDQVKEQLSRAPFAEPELFLTPFIDDIDQFKMEDIDVIGYECHPAIKAPMAE